MWKGEGCPGGCVSGGKDVGGGGWTTSVRVGEGVVGERWVYDGKENADLVCIYSRYPLPGSSGWEVYDSL